MKITPTSCTTILISRNQTWFREQPRTNNLPFSRTGTRFGPGYFLNRVSARVAA